MKKLVISAILITACAKAPAEQKQVPVQRPHMTLPEPATEKPANAPKKPEPKEPVQDEKAQGEPNKPTSFSESIDALVSSGHDKMATIIQSLVNQKKKKMKLTEDEGFRAANYLLESLSEMDNTRKLAEQLPKAIIELVMAVHERGVKQKDAEEISAFLLTFLAHLKLLHPAKFDENLSHVIGRQWHEIDYSGEKMTWQKAQASFTPMGVVDFRKAEYVEIYFRWESKKQFFMRIYQPQGRLPD
jgi:hypothetical protein